MEDLDHPSRYMHGDKDVIDILPDLIGKERAIGFMQGNIIKYTVRFPEKGQAKDLDKVIVYAKRLKEMVYGDK